MLNRLKFRKEDVILKAKPRAVTLSLALDINLKQTLVNLVRALNHLLEEIFTVFLHNTKLVIITA